MNLNGPIPSRTFLVHQPKMSAPKQTDPQFKLRLPPELKAKIEAVASDNNRSMNAEMLVRLEASFERETAAAERIAEQAVEMIRRRLDEAGWFERVREKEEDEEPNDGR